MKFSEFIDQKKNETITVFAVIIWLTTFIPLLRITYHLNIIYPRADGALFSMEAVLAAACAVLSLGAFLVGLISVLRKKSTLYIFLYFGFHGLLSIPISIFTPLFLYVTVISIWGMVLAKRLTNETRRFVPRFGTKQAYGLLLIAIVSVTVPVAAYFNPPTYTFTLKYDAAIVKDNIEVNFALANATEMPADLLQIMIDSNNIPGLNVSFEMPILEQFILNVSKIFGFEEPKRDDYVKPYEGYYVAEGDFYNFSAYKEDLDRFNNDWNQYGRDVNGNVSKLTYDELMALEASDFLLDGLLANQTRTFYNNGLAVDYMPLVEAEVYINDFTIVRFNKTLTLMKRFIELAGLENKHRGLIIDTERMWGQDDSTILAYHDYKTHNVGLELLGDMVKMLKEWEWEWKGGVGDYSHDAWKTQMVDAKKTYVGSATFGIHIDDLWDKDDGQQNFFKISILTAEEDEQFDFIGIMTYETGPNSDHAVYGYCRAGDYFFGEANVPYIYSGTDNFEDIKDDPEAYIDAITRKFIIARNYGYDVMGIWGLTHLYCHASSGFNQSWCGGLYDVLKVFNMQGRIYDMMLNLTKPSDITFVVSDYNFAYVHTGLTLLDAYLITEKRYGDWPINENVRIRPNEF